MRSDAEKLAKISECIDRIERFTREGKDAFFKEEMRQDAVLRNFQIIGEAVKELSQDLREKYPNVPWREVARFRDRVTHDYFSVNIDTVWQIIEEDVPNLKVQIEQIIRNK